MSDKGGPPLCCDGMGGGWRQETEAELQEQYARRPDGLPYALPDTQEELGKQEAAILDGLGFKEPCERVSGVCPRRGFDFSPPCERVTMGCCPKCCEHLGFKCAYHGCPWPDEEKECPA